MLKRERAWRERHKLAAARVTKIRIDRCLIEKLPGQEGYVAIIDGFNLHQAVSPPRVIVGGVPAAALAFSSDGKRLRATLPREPEEDGVSVDYGFARAEGRVDWTKAR